VLQETQKLFGNGTIDSELACFAASLYFIDVNDDMFSALILTHLAK
jgi:hypothetical protein